MQISADYDHKKVSGAVSVKLAILNYRGMGAEHRVNLKKDLARLIESMNQEERRHYERRVE